VLGGENRLFRPPYGWVDLRTAARLRRRWPGAWIWSVDPEDWMPTAQSEEIVAVGDTIAAGDVMLLHDGVCHPEAEESLDRSQTIAAVPAIVERARARGLEPVPLPPRSYSEGLTFR
jgi:peptidoglycan/xylan/chitin deacetylase (PgdA/CDA1 family)